MLIKKTVLLYVAAGGAIGSILRWQISIWTLPFNGLNYNFPLATFICNILGCVLLGTLVACLNRGLMLRPSVEIGLRVGLIGSFTTFSAWSLESLLLLQQGKLLIMMIYGLTSFGFGLLLAIVGYKWGERLCNRSTNHRNWK